MLEQTSEADALGPDYDFPLCTLPWTPDECSRRFGITFEIHNEDGLGPCMFAWLSINGLSVMLRGHPHGPPVAHNATVFIPLSTPDSAIAFSQVINAFGLAREHVLWIAPSLGPAIWSVVRYDDHSNRFEVGRYLTSLAAERIRHQHDGKGHKQAYFVERAA